MKMFINIIIEEEWKLITYKNILPLYEISNYGRVKTIKKNRILYCNDPSNEGGYCRVKLKTTDGRKKFSVHRLVLIHFNEISVDEEKYMQVNHKNKERSNNYLNNLEWCTAKENMRHKVIFDNLYGEKVFNSKLTDTEVFEICKVLEEGKHNSEIIEKFSLNKKYTNPTGFLSNLRHSKGWKHITMQFNLPKKQYKKYTTEQVQLAKKICSKALTVTQILKEMDLDENSRDFIKNIKSGRRHKKNLV